jgi:hypothetical protein
MILTAKYYAEGGESKCQPDEYWNGKKCVKLPKNAFVTSDPKKYAFRKAAYDDSLTGYNNMNYVNSFFTGKRKNGVPIYNWKGFDKNKIKSSSVKPTSYKDFYREGHEHEGTGQLAKFKKPVQPVVFQEVYKSVVPTTRTVYIECPPGSVSNDEKTEVITNDPDSPGNYLRTITTGCKPEKIENLQLLKPGLIDPTKDELQGNNLNEEELELPNEEVESEYLEEGSPDTENAMEWVNKRKYNIDWDGIQIPYRLPRFRKPGSYGDLIKPGKKRYINLPKITSRNTAYLREKQDGGELCPKGMVWSKKDKKCIDLPVFNSGLNNGTLEKFTNLSDGLIIKPLNSFSDFGKIKPKKIPVVEDSFLETLEKDINDFLDNPLKKAAQVSESLKEKGEDPSDALRHSIAGALAAQTIANKTGNIPFISNPLGYLGANIAGIGHELSTLSQTYLDDRPWKIKLQESLEDIYNNSVGANTIFNNNSEKDKINYLLKLTRTNQLPDGYGEERPFRDNPKWTDPYNQKQYGGINKFDGGGEKNKCKDGEYWDGTKCTKLISYATDKKFIDGVSNWAMHSVNPDQISSEYNDQIKNYLYSGKYGYDPVSMSLIPLSTINKKLISEPNQETKKILAKQYDKASYRQSIIDAGFDPETFGKSKGTNVITGEEIYGDKSQEDVDKINKEAVNDFVTEGHKQAILESPFNTAAFFTPAGMAAGAMQGAAHLLPDIYDFGKDPSWSGAGAVGMDALMMSPAARGIGKFLGTESGVLSNTYKINPLAEKLNNVNKSYRVAGIDALKHFENTGILKSVTPTPPKGANLFERAKYRSTAFPSFQKGYADMRYLPEEGGVVFETNLPTFKRGDINPVTGTPIKGKHYAHRAIDPKTGATMSEIPGSEIRMFGDKPHWLKGYPEVPKQLPGSLNNINQSVIPTQSLINKLHRKLNNVPAFFKQVVGKTLKGKNNKKSVDEGNKWLTNWINDPITQKKIDLDWQQYNSRSNFFKRSI